MRRFIHVPKLEAIVSSEYLNEFAIKTTKTDNLGETAQVVAICLLQDHILLSFVDL